MSSLESKSFSAPTSEGRSSTRGTSTSCRCGERGRASHLRARLAVVRARRPDRRVDDCDATHIGVVLSGRQRIRMTTAPSVEIGPGDVFHIPPGHDGWTVGDEPCVLLDFVGAASYARPG